MTNISLTSLLKGKKGNGQPHPTRDWFLMLGVMLLLLLGGAAWNIWVFTQIESGKSLGGAVQVAPHADSIQVTDVQDLFKNRAAERVHYQSDYKFVDPATPGS